ncbi:MAG: hypothetical protein DMG80_20910 [Acidobacteria bacterium]|nr:MAG: hypothetical protein DMG80_20910 [Acidobacteriota bacterium]
MPKLPEFIPVDAASLLCTKCGAKPGIACGTLKNGTELIHAERIKAAATKGTAVRKAPRK